MTTLSPPRAGLRDWQIRPCTGGNDPWCEENGPFRAGGIWVHLRNRFCDVFIANELIDEALKSAKRQRQTPLQRAETARNIALGLVCGSYQ